MFSADLFYHHKGLASYIEKCKRVMPKQTKTVQRNKKKNYRTILQCHKIIIDGKSGISLSDVCDMINEKENK